MAYDDTIQKPISELPIDISFDKHDWTKNWSYGKWGYADYAITHVLEDGTEHRYKLPKVIGQMIEREREQGKKEAQRDAQCAWFGVNMTELTDKQFIEELNKIYFKKLDTLDRLEGQGYNKSSYTKTQLAKYNNIIIESFPRIVKLLQSQESIIYAVDLVIPSIAEEAGMSEKEIDDLENIHPADALQIIEQAMLKNFE